ncbi:germination protein, Ger(x)C family [Terribacillus aidingensis]|uniref:Germination protein, Ger(X)C family n=1 Tax=Terribacillus aidingensis TaxID=586416 RepID=A0A285MYJ3_9BACI|nr:Ger(x)C family spore germination protein [Terribacillus aidingensis]SNZ02168.1 germination protein, Ger(x)C family [Terribacillus aidingensis]
MRKLLVMIVCIPMIILLSGCTDRKEIEEQAFVVAVGVDKTDKPNIFRFTFQIANPEVGSSTISPSPNESPQELVSVLGADFLSATNAANSSVAKEITLEQVRVVIISSKLAKSNEFIHLMQTVPSTVELRLNAQLVVSKEKAADFLQQNKPKMETRPHKYYQYMLDRAKETGIIPDAPLSRFYYITEGDADLFIAPLATVKPEDKQEYKSEDKYTAGDIPLKGENKTQFMGSALFKEGKMIDELTGEETRISVMLDPTLSQQDFIANYKDPLKPDYKIAARFKAEEPKITVDYRPNGKTTIYADINFRLDVYSIPSTVNYISDDKKRELLRNNLERQLKQMTEKFIEVTQKKYKGEPFYWSLHIRRHFLTIQDYEKADWSKKIYPNAEIKMNFRLTSLEFGKVLRQSDLGRVKD